MMLYIETTHGDFMIDEWDLPVDIKELLYSSKLFEPTISANAPIHFRRVKHYDDFTAIANEVACDFPNIITLVYYNSAHYTFVGNNNVKWKIK